MIICSKLDDECVTKGFKSVCEGTCGEDIWISDSSIETVNNQAPGAKIVAVCIDCSAKIIANHNGMESKIMSMSQEQLEEILKLINKKK